MKILQKIGRFDSISPRQRKKFIWKVCALTKFEDRPFEIDFFGLNYKGHTKNLIDRYVFFLGAYEKGMLEFIRETLEQSKDKVFIDIGANVGHHALFASKYAKQVYAFEPYEKVRLALDEKVAINKLKNVKVIPFALGAKDEELSFYEPADFNTGTGSFLKDFKPTNQDKGLKLIVKNGAPLFEELGITTASLVKLDTEGFEASVLKGLMPFLEKTKPIIIMEYSSESERLFKDSPEVRDFMERTYNMWMFNNPNKLNYQLRPWAFDKYGDTVLLPR
ncbi:MAG TPA: FkbM family methyltransferase [Bacteriovoracaceae bacterium]|nr:FkbM family methyltransferase [Bacteriovoracaceae bacterium]